MKTDVLKLRIAPSGKKYFILPIQSPALCDLQDEYGYTGYRSDYGDVINYVSGIACYVFEEDEARAEEFFRRAAPLIAAAIAEDAKAEAEHEALLLNIQAENHKLEEAWDKKFPHGRRIYFSAWGGDFEEPDFAIQKSIFDSPSDVVAAAICRKNRMVRGSRVCSQGTSLTNNRPDSDHYSFSMGTPYPGGGVSGDYQVWFSISR